MWRGEEESVRRGEWEGGECEEGRRECEERRMGV